jgi:hypothetical protein
LLDCKTRPVKKSDKWCQRKLVNGKVPVGNAPWGYIVAIPNCPEKYKLLENVDGYIVRSKKHCGDFLLQVIKKEDSPQYAINSFIRQEKCVSKKKRKAKKRFRHILNINNFRKIGVEW